MIYQLFGATLWAQGDDQGVVSVWQLPSRTVIWSSEGCPYAHQGAITTLTWSSDGHYLASGSSDTTIKIWDAVTGKLLQAYTGHVSRVLAVAWSPDGNCIVSSAAHDSPRIWTPCTSTRNLCDSDEYTYSSPC